MSDIKKDNEAKTREDGIATAGRAMSWDDFATSHYRYAADDDRQKAAPAPAMAKKDLSKEPLGAYTPASTKPLEPAKKLDGAAWDKEGKRPWNASPQGRLAIRTFSRGVMGAMFFTGGNLLASKWTQGYDPTKGFFEQGNLLKMVAKFIDTAAGKPIAFTVRTLTGSEEKAINSVHFRPTRYTTEYLQRTASGEWSPIKVAGRSLGAETVNITFDFFCASVGDAWGRDIAGFIDPHVPKPWHDKNGHFSVTEAVKHTLKAATRYVTYNGGEDWAVAIPYAYYMKGQRALIDHLSPGFKYDFDRSLNGGSFKVDKDGNVIGTYSIEGAADLQGRFTVYNIGTLMYREIWDYVAHKLQGHPTALYGSPDKPVEKRSILGHMRELGKWVVRSTLKGGMYMTPVVPAFWITRAAQFKDEGLFINKEKGVITHVFKKDMDGKEVCIIASLRAEDKIHATSPAESKEDLFFSDYNPKEHGGDGWRVRLSDIEQGVYPDRLRNIPLVNGKFNPYEVNLTNMGDKLFGSIGKTNSHVTKFVRKEFFRGENFLSRKMNVSLKSKLIKTLGSQGFNRFPIIYSNAAVSYTPYMYAKAEAARLWDTGTMDMALERTIDGASRLNWGEFKAGLGETWNAIIHKPMSDPAREEEAQRRDELDTSPSVDIARGQKKVTKNNPTLTWEQRIIASRPAKEAKTDNKEKDKSTTRATSYSEQEALRKALDKFDPPTNSVH